MSSTPNPKPRPDPPRSLDDALRRYDAFVSRAIDPATVPTEKAIAERHIRELEATNPGLREAWLLRQGKTALRDRLTGRDPKPTVDRVVRRSPDIFKNVAMDAANALGERVSEYLDEYLDNLFDAAEEGLMTTSTGTKTTKAKAKATETPRAPKGTKKERMFERFADDVGVELLDEWEEDDAPKGKKKNTDPISGYELTLDAPRPLLEEMAEDGELASAFFEWLLGVLDEAEDEDEDDEDDEDDEGDPDDEDDD